MSHWNYRIVHYEDEGEALGIHEVYYDDQGNIESWSDKPSVVGNDLEDLHCEFANLQKAFKLGVLESSTLPGEQVEVVKEPNTLEKEATATTSRAEVLAYIETFHGTDWELIENVTEILSQGQGQPTQAAPVEGKEGE